MYANSKNISIFNPQTKTMGKKDPRIDAYISKAAPFAKPVLTHIRKLIHQGCPDTEETIKWGMPSFDYKGPYCSMASFREHCAFGFWKAALMEDAKTLKVNQKNSMGHLEGSQVWKISLLIR